ncbi:MAG: GNAT family N-acetyltransferase [Clostridia bacterium]|nr:GNAT family N-acetyltransferase [Clostridia bacterium]
MMELRKINTRDAFAQWEYTSALPADENGLTNPYHGSTYDEYINRVLPELISHEHPVHMPDWFVPETYYYLWDDNSLVGEFRIRHRLTDALRTGAGHIGYSIRKNERGKGYGTAGLRLTLEIARSIIPEEEVYLRVNKDNIASQKVMLKNGARITGEDSEHFFMRIPK